MTIHSVEQILDSMIALLIYGSGAWLSYSLVTFVVTRPKASVYQDTEKVSQQVAKPIDAIPELTSELSVSAQPVKVPQIDCQPVDWKKWKVDELRQASITHVCGVRTSPIGSSRKLTKSNLIAQYEQNLKRMTYEQPNFVLQREKIA